MSDGRNVIYCYDGTFDGLMCCVFESFERREIPSEISIGEPCQLSFSDIRFIETVTEKSDRVTAAIPQKISWDALDLVRKVFLSCAENKDLTILIFLQKGFRKGIKIMQMLADDTVNAMNKAVFHCTHEAHLLTGFIRFSDYNGYLAAVIEPKNKVIPLLASHFTDRFRNENFLIYDKTHRMALIYYSHKAEIAENIDFELPPASAEEEHYRELWKGFYQTIGIKERFNPKCRMNLMPKRFWSNMTEMRDELGIRDESTNRIAETNPTAISN
ncbi:MAG: TIGR03915 family putative DNA repair protein [Oscillospiraceae bacterium]